MLWGRKRIHFMGAGGSGMKPLARLALMEGHAVSCCDRARGRWLEELRALGAEVREGHSPDHVVGMDLLVRSRAVPPTSAEVSAALDAGIPVLARDELLSEAERAHIGVAVSGTHGKTTTAAMLAWILMCEGLKPTYVVGGDPLDMPCSLSGGELFVYEADEYQKALLSSNPCFAGVTALELEHVDTYPSEEELFSTFAAFLGKLPAWGDAVVLSGGALAADLLSLRIKARIRSVGYDDGAWVRIEEFEEHPEDGRGLCFSLRIGEGPTLRVRLSVLGAHNVENAAVAVGLSVLLGVHPEHACEALEGFRGVMRRLEVRSRHPVLLIDDYAHHPTEVAAGIKAIKGRWPQKRLVVVFEPHLYSRTLAFADGFADALAGADFVVLLPVYGAREAGTGNELDALVKAAEERGCRLEVAEDYEHAAQAAMKLRPGIVLTMGAGPVRRVGDLLLSKGGVG